MMRRWSTGWPLAAGTREVRAFSIIMRTHALLCSALISFNLHLTAWDCLLSIHPSMLHRSIGPCVVPYPSFHCFLGGRATALCQLNALPWHVLYNDQTYGETHCRLARKLPLSTGLSAATTTTTHVDRRSNDCMFGWSTQATSYSIHHSVCPSIYHRSSLSPHATTGPAAAVIACDHGTVHS